MVDAIVPKTVGPIQKLKRVTPGAEKPADAPQQPLEPEPETEQSTDDTPRRGTRIDDHA